MCDRRFPECVVKRKKIQLDSKESKKKSNWPIAKEGRERLKRRTAELRARGVPSPFGRVSVSGQEYLPSPRQKIVLTKLKSQVATLIGTAPTDLSTPNSRLIDAWPIARRWATIGGSSRSCSGSNKHQTLGCAVCGGA